MISNYFWLSAALAGTNFFSVILEIVRSAVASFFNVPDVGRGDPSLSPCMNKVYK